MGITTLLFKRKCIWAEHDAKFHSKEGRYSPKFHSVANLSRQQVYCIWQLALLSLQAVNRYFRGCLNSVITMLYMGANSSQMYLMKVKFVFTGVCAHSLWLMWPSKKLTCSYHCTLIDFYDCRYGKFMQVSLTIRENNRIRIVCVVA